MDFYYVHDDYVRFLKKVDSQVPDNDGEKRPYIGVVVAIEGIEYYAPLTSPKQKHQKMKNSKDFRKIAGGKYGAINFNNMIPVPQDALTHIVINDIEDPTYQRLLRNQYSAVQSDSPQIQKTAEKLRSLVFTDDAKLSKHDREVKSRCCRLKDLESAMASYRNEQ